MNIVNDPGFETAGTWSLSDEGAVRLTEAARSGAFGLRLSLYNVGEEPEPIVKVGGSATAVLSLVPQQIYPVSLYARGAGARGSALVVQVDRGNGALDTTFQVPAVGNSTYGLCALGSFVALNTSGRLKISIGLGGTVPGFWDVDDVSVQGPLTGDAMIEQIRANALTKLNGINTMSGHLTTIAYVGTEQPKPDNLPATPALFLRFVSIKSQDAGRLGYIDRKAYYAVFMFVQDEDATPDLVENLVMDVGRALEADQTFGGLSFVKENEGRAVLFSEIDPFDVGEEVRRNGYTGYTGLLRVSYSAPSGTF